MLTAAALKWLPIPLFPTESFYQEIWDISRLLTHFSLLFLALSSQSHISGLSGVAKSVVFIIRLGDRGNREKTFYPEFNFDLQHDSKLNPVPVQGCS